LSHRTCLGQLDIQVEPKAYFIECNPIMLPSVSSTSAM
jgi:hypothetical protein